jgi:hypothetical protein
MSFWHGIVLASIGWCMMMHSIQFLMVHSAISGQLMYGSDLGNKVGLLKAYIRSDLGYINEYEFVHMWSKVDLS